MADVGNVLQEAGVTVPDQAVEQLNVYAAILLDWNRRMDLTSVSDSDTGLRHFLDSLLPLREEGLFPVGARIIDVGSGAGFPGLPLAIARPDLRVTLLEAQGKRCQFLNAVIDALNLQNVTVIQDRAETLGRAAEHRESYDRAVARAVAPLNVLCEYLMPFVRVGGMALCWKGPSVADEMADGEAAAGLLGGRVLEAMDMSAGDTRHLLIPIQKIEKTLPQYPRKNGIPAKRPLKSAKNRQGTVE